MDPVDIANLALGWLGVKQIASFDDPSPAGRRVKSVFAGLRDSVLEDADWSFATERRELPRDGTTPLFGYASRYLMPSDVITVRKAFPSVVTGLIDAFAASLEPTDSDFMAWEIESGTNSAGQRGRYILADTIATSLYVKAIVRVEDHTLWSPTFTQALAARLAADLCVPLTEDKALAAQMWQLYKVKLDAATGNDAKQGMPDRVFRVSSLAMRRR